MNIHITPKSAAVAALIAATAAAIALGPLNPPAGPVTETTPSLANIQADLEQILLNQTNAGQDLAYTAFHAPDSGEFTSSTTSTPIFSGPAYVHEIIVYQGAVTLFDGPGAIDPSDRPLTTNWIGRATNNYVNGGTGRGQATSTTIPVRQNVQTGLEAAWRALSSEGSLIVLYRPIQGANP